MKRLSLSFDNGPFPDVTPRVLDSLAYHAATATFFVCGNHASGEREREILRRARAEGHRIGNHTHSHSVELGGSDDPAAPESEIGRAQEVLRDFVEPERLFRPYGAGGVLGPRLLSPAAVSYLCDGGYTCVLWNSVPRDWERIREWPEHAGQDIERQDWTLLVLHDVPTGAMEQLPRFLDSVREQGIEIVAEFPPECVPIRAGVAQPGLSEYVQAGC